MRLSAGLGILLVALVLSGPIISSGHVLVYAVDVLSPEDKANLTNYLQQLSLNWVQEAVDAANSIFSKETYDPLAWADFFGEYFSANPLTDELKTYIQYPMFWWLSETVHYNLQEGLPDPLMNRIAVIMEAHPNANDLSTALNSDSNLLQTLMNSHRLLNKIAKQQAISTQKRNLIYGFYKALVSGHLNLLSSAVTFDPSSQPYVGVVRAQTHINLRDTLPLSLQLKNEIAQTIELAGSHLSIWNAFSVLVEDNHVLDATQLNVVYTVLDDMPSRLNTLEMITQNDALGNVGSKYQYLEGRWINIFNSPVGASSADPFVNSEVSSRPTDWFTVVVIHELNHMFAAEYIHEPSGAIDQRELALISAADAVQDRYLASYIFTWFPGYATDDFFVRYPQEFFAYLSGVWWADSFHGFELAFVRFSANNPEPMNQFLFFADAYSHGSDHTYFYTTDTQGLVTRTSITITRDAKGRMNSFTHDGIRYWFALDENGNVLSITEQQVQPRPTRISYNAYDSSDPSVAVSESYVYVAWSDSTPVSGSGDKPEIWLRVSSNYGGTFGPATRISRNAYGSYVPSVAASGSYVYIVWQDSTPVPGSGTWPEIWLRVSSNYGASFGSAIRMSYNTYASESPRVAAYGNYVFVVWEDYTPVAGSGSQSEIWLRASSNNGATFGPAIRISYNTYASNVPSVATSGSYVYVAWSDGTPVEGSGGTYEVWMRTSSNNGGSFGAPIRMSRNTWDSYPPSVVAYGSYVYVAWEDWTPVSGSGSASEVWMRRSSNNGGSFGSPIRITTNTGASQDPSVAADSSYVYVAWHDHTPVSGSGSEPEIWMRVSTNNGASFSSAIRITTNTGDSDFASVAASGNQWYVAWEDWTSVSDSGTAPEIWLKVGS